MAAGKYNIIIQKKATFARKFKIYTTYVAEGSADNVPVDLTGCTVSSKIKRKVDDTSAIITFDTAVTDAENGEFELRLTAAQTASLSFDRGVYDVLVTYADTTVDKVLEGTVVLDRTVT